MTCNAKAPRKLLLALATTMLLLAACNPGATATVAPTATTAPSPTPTPPSVPDVQDLTLDDAPDLVALLGNDSPSIRREAAALLMELTLQVGLGALTDIGPQIEDHVPELIEALQRAEIGSSEVRWAAVCALGCVGPEAEEAVPVLVDSLRDPDTEVRQVTAWALGRMGSHAADAVPALVQALGDEDAYCRSMSARALGEMGGAAGEAATSLVESLTDEAPMVREAAAWALGQIGAGSPEVVTALRERLLDTSDDVVESASQALEAVVGPLPTVEEVLLRYDEEVRPLAEALQAAEQGPGGADIALPGAAKWRIMLVPLSERLHYVQTVLYPEWTLGTGDGPANLYVLYTCERGEGLAYGIVPMTPETQEVIAEITLVAETDGGYCVLEKQEGLGGAGSRDERDLVESAVKPLQLLGAAGLEVESVLEMIVAYASGQAWRGPFETRQKVAVLQWVLSSPYWADRRQAAEALGAIGPEAMDAVPALIEAIETSGSTVDSAAASALEDITGQDFGRDAAAWRLWLESPEEAYSERVSELVEELRDENPSVRAVAAYELGELGPEAAPAVPALIEALTDEDAGVRGAVAYALEQIGAEAVEAIPALVEALSDENADVQVYAAVAVIEIGLADGSEEAVVPVLEALRDEEAEVRTWAAMILTEIGFQASEQAVPALIEALDDEVASVRETALEALEAITGQDLGEDAETWELWWESQQ